MIDRGEILQAASMRRLRPDVIEKDYILGWMLTGIFSHPVLGPAWVFKGGTCLKKCYVETYRFSEDLDFTIEDAEQMDDGFLRKAFSEVAEWIYDQTGIEIPPNELRFDVYRNRRGGLNVEGRVYYRGPLLPRGSLPRVKLDLTTDERLVRPPVWQAVVHHYTDSPEGGMVARCYQFEELFGEKIRALGERARPRDLYDVVNLFWNEQLRPAASDVHRVLREKCQYKGIGIPDTASLEPFKDELTNDWETMLGHQLPALPSFGSFWDAIPTFFHWLQEGVTPVSPPGIPYDRGEVEISGEPELLDLEVGSTAVLETIRFAAVNRLCIDLRYRDAVHRVEPYSLRRTLDGVPVLYACPMDHGDYRIYPIGVIEGVDFVGEPFEPRYFVDLKPKRLPGTGPLG